MENMNLKAAANLKELEARVALCAKLGLSAEVDNKNLSSLANVLFLARRGIELANEVQKESRYPSRWNAFYLGVGFALVLHAIFGG